ncbi:MAG: hypothetical protein M1822_009847 [Bathelium mastoideum]|nr:MAG: hypothetical protein M1822_009847 [Bathelium mastoideum]
MRRSPTPSSSPRSTTPQPNARHGRSRSSDSRTGRTTASLFVPGLVANSENDARRPSVQFASPFRSDAASPSPARQSPRRALSYQSRSRSGRRMSSPPPPPFTEESCLDTITSSFTNHFFYSAKIMSLYRKTHPAIRRSLKVFAVFQPRVSFDTFDNKEASDFSLTLQSKHKDYEYSKRSRTFLCGTDTNDYSEFALEWLIDELVDDGDEIVCLRVVEKDSKFAGDSSIEEGRYRAEADKMMQYIQGKNVENKAINLILEFSVGKIQDTIQAMIRIYEPAILVVGTRGRSLGGFQGLLPGSVSKWCLQHSPVPVIVVRPSSKRDKKKRKRLQDPARRGYKDILDKSGTEGTHIHMVGAAVADDHHGTEEATDAEAAAVLAAIGYRPGPEFEEVAELQRTQSVKSDLTNLSDASSPNDLKSPGVMMKSPELQNLESPPLSEASSEGEDEDQDDDDDRDEGVEAIPGHVLLAQDEVNQKARQEEKETEGQDGHESGEEKAGEKDRGGTGDLVENVKPEQNANIDSTEGRNQG